MSLFSQFSVCSISHISQNSTFMRALHQSGSLMNFCIVLLSFPTHQNPFLVGTSLRKANVHLINDELLSVTHSHYYSYTVNYPKGELRE